MNSRDIQLKDLSKETRGSSAVVPHENDIDDGIEIEIEIEQKSVDGSKKAMSQCDEESGNVIRSRKDATYQGSLHNIPLFNENPDEYHRQMITTTEQINQIQPKKSFFSQIAEQIDLKLLKDLSFALFAVSNFLTSLGFNVPYNFANDLAGDAKVVEHRRHWILMSIGISNCFGRVIIGFLADKKVLILFSH